MTIQPSAHRSRRTLVHCLLATALSASTLSAPAPAVEAAPAAAAPAAALEVSGLEVRVVDLEGAVDFFKLYGFTVAGERSAGAATVRNGSSVIDLVKVPRKLEIEDDGTANTHINLRVDDLAAATGELQAKAGYRFVGELRRTSPVGAYAIVKDPSGNIFHLMEPSPRPEGGTKRGIFNVGIAVTDMVKAREFYRDKLGFEIFSEDYFPPDLPLKRKGALPLVLHQTAKAPAAAGYPDIAESIVVLRTPDLAKTMAGLKARGIRFLDDQPRRSPLGTFAAFVDPFGNVLELREAAAQASR
jgi:catechol 2,3-dioxygenase-like lactoylglutathione lyase family enzyme